MHEQFEALGDAWLMEIVWKDCFCRDICAGKFIFLPNLHEVCWVLTMKDEKGNLMSLHF